MSLSLTRVSAPVLGAFLLALLTACGGSGGGGGTLPSTHGASLARRVPSLASASAHIESVSTAASADGAHALAMSDVGSSNPTSAQAPVPRPHEAPCVVQLFTHQTYAGFAPQTFSYAPQCPGPWKEIVLDADFNVTAGRQYDRTASIWLDGTNVYFGTTAEPSQSVSPSWHVERDVTDLAPIFAVASTGETILGNVYNSTYNGLPSASAKLEFYPAQGGADGPTTTGDQQGVGGQGLLVHDIADAVYPLASSSMGDNAILGNPSSQLAQTITFPRNVERAYLDVYLQSQSNDEFWYTCFPNDLAAETGNCGSTAFREGEVSIDGQPAGVAPVYPWIYTGGIDPFLWRPIPGVETLEFSPYRVDLTPFAGVLSDGAPHTVAVTVANADSYFSANGALLVYLDHGSQSVSGAVIANTSDPQPIANVAENISTDPSGNISGSVDTTATHNVAVTGYVDTSKGRITTTVRQSVQFDNNQTNIVVSGTQFQQDIAQNTKITSQTTRTGTGLNESSNVVASWPLTVDYNYVVNPDGSQVQTVSVDQEKHESRNDVTARGPISSTLSWIDSAADTLTFPTSGGYTASGQTAKQTYAFSTNRGVCFNKTVTAANGTVKSDAGGGC